MDWFFITIISYFILALVGIADKFLLNKVITDDRLYTFLVGTLGILVFLFAPFGLEWPGITGFILNIIAGAFSIVALMLFYRSLKVGEASIVIPFIGGGTPILVFILSWLFLGERFSGRYFLAIIFLLSGGILITFIPKETRHWWQFWKKKKTQGNRLALLSALGFALFFVLSKYLYDTQGFVSAFIWARLGAFLVAIAMLYNLAFRKTAVKFIKKFTQGKRYLFLINQSLGAIGFVALNYAISISKVSLVNALQGVQYVFLLLLAGIITLKWPHIIKERLSKKVIIEKGIAVLLIGIGLFIIAFSNY